jgi:hypothetical protein
LEFSAGQKAFLTAHGRLAFQANSGFLQQMIQQVSYEGDGNNTDYGLSDEWVNNYDKI